MLGCGNQQKKQAAQAAPPHLLLHSKPKLVYRPTSPNPAVYDLLPVHGDTLIAVKWHGGLAVTTDAGQHWTGLHDQRNKPDFVHFKYLTLDQHHVLWGLDSWPGIHEPAYSRLAYSTDFGKTWTRQAFDTHTFFPYTFYSHPGQALQVVTYEGNVYQLQDRLGKKWKGSRALAELNNTVNDTIAVDSYHDGARFRFLAGGQVFARAKQGWHLITTLPFINSLDDACSCNGSLYLLGYNTSTPYPSSHYLVRLKGNQLKDTIRLQEEQQQLRCDSKGRLWLFSFRGVWEKTGQNFAKRY
jgi:hypothetical protein